MPRIGLRSGGTTFSHLRAGLTSAAGSALGQCELPRRRVFGYRGRRSWDWSWRRTGAPEPHYSLLSSEPAALDRLLSARKSAPLMGTEPEAGRELFRSLRRAVNDSPRWRPSPAHGDGQEARVKPTTQTDLAMGDQWDAASAPMVPAFGLRQRRRRDHRALRTPTASLTSWGQVRSRASSSQVAQCHLHR